MIDFIQFCFIASLWCVGIALATDEGFVLHKVDLLAHKYLPIWLYKPLIGCGYCTASVHGITLYLLGCLYGWLDFNALELIVCVPVISALNGIIYNIHQKLL